MSVIVLEDGETLFNAFEDRNFTRGQRGNHEVRVLSGYELAVYRAEPW
jgi:hypothetical protein